jgi:receptor protein-tyrosine kinase
MSLIEQAARRLEELRKAGAQLPEGSAPAAREVPGPRTDRDVVPTPEAVADAIAAQVHVAAGVAPDRAALPPVLGGRPGDGAPFAPTVGRRVDIDIDRLRELGFVTPDAPKAQIADEFRVIKRPIIRNARVAAGPRSRPMNLVMVTSALPGEGKTFTATNLAISVAMELDSSVLLVDGDVAHPALPDLLGVPSSPGLLDLLTEGRVDVADALVKTNIDKLTILPAGSRHRRATELLASEQMASLLRELATRYRDRIVIFDSPPLLATTEARVLATHMGQIIVVVAANATTQRAVDQALSTIENCEIVLMMLNKVTTSEVGSYYGLYRDAEAP